MLFNEPFTLYKANKAEKKQLLMKFDHIIEQLLTSNE